MVEECKTYINSRNIKSNNMLVTGFGTKIYLMPSVNFLFFCCVKCELEHPGVLFSDYEPKSSYVFKTRVFDLQL